MFRFLFFSLGIGLLLMGILLGGELSLFIDLPSLVMTVGGGLVFCFGVHSPSDLNAALRIANGRDVLSPSDAQKHDAVLETFSNTLIASGVIGTLIGMVNMLSHMDNPKHIGPACAVAILTLLYAAILSGVVINPLRGRLKSRVDGAMASSKGPSATLPASLFIMITVLFMTMTVLEIS